MIDPRELLERQHAWRACAEAGGPEAEAYAVDTLSAAALAIDKLHANLRRLGYPRVPGRIRCARGLDGRLKRLTKTLGGELPAALGTFWRHIGGVSFADLETYRHVKFWRQLGIEGASGYSDAFHIDPCVPEWVSMVEESRADAPSAPVDGEAQPFEVNVAPDGFHKDDISGGTPYAFHIRSDWLAPLLNFEWSGWTHPTSIPHDTFDLLSVTRTTILECAGFPGFLGQEAFEPIRMRLLADVPAF